MRDRGHARSALAILVLACQGDPEHPPPAPPCTDGCNPPTGGIPPAGGASGASSGGKAGAAAGGAGASSGGASGSGGATPGELTGTVDEFTDATFRFSQAFTQSAVVETQGTSGSLVSANWNGSDPFRLTGFAPSLTTWIQVRPAVGAAWLPTVQLADTRVGGSTALEIVPVDIVDFILSLSTTSAERTPGRGHAVLLFTQRSDPTQGVPGIGVTLPDAAVVLYATQGSWSDVETETDAAGLVFLGNIATSGFPGSTKGVTLRGMRTGSVELRVASDAITALEVPTP